MWNGLWKLTAMVGVVGVGLFAAYQAQLGMNRSSFFGTGASVAEKGDPEATEETSTDEATSPDSPKAEDSFDLFAQTDNEPAAKKSQPTKRKSFDAEDDLFSKVDDDQAAARKSATDKSSSGQSAAAKRNQRKGIDFREEIAEFEDSGTTGTTPADDSAAEPPQKKSRQSARDLMTQSEPAKDSSDADVNPFAEEIADASAVKKAAEKIEKTVEKTANVLEQDVAQGETINIEAKQEPGRVRINTEVTANSDIPRSKRAKRNTARRIEAAAETGSDNLGFDSKPGIVQTASVNDPVTDDSAPVLGAPELLDDSSDSNSSGKKSTSTGAPRSLPADSVSEDPQPARTPPKRNRNSQPAADSFLDGPGTTQLRSREAVQAASDDRSSALDLVGDGEIGDSAIKGLQQPRLSIEKITQQQAVLEQPLIYTIVVKNTGSVDAHNIVIEDRIPKGSELQGTSPQAEMTGKRLIWNHALLKPNEEKRISIKVIPKQEGPIGSVARVYFATEVTNEIVVMAPQLDFQVKAPAEVRIGQKFEMVFTLKNTGKVEATNIVVRDLVPESLKHDMGTDIECPIGKLAPQEVRELALQVTAVKTGSVINRAMLAADSGIRKTLDSPIDVVGEVLVLTRSGQNRLYVERPVVFTNNIRNDGNQKAERVKIAEVVPAGMEFETASDGGKYDASLRTVVWTLGPLAPGNDRSVTVKYIPKETGTMAAKVTAVGNLGSTAAIDSKIDVIGKPELQMETLSATGTVTLGEQITSRFQLNNTGTAAANNVQLRIKLPRQLKLISVKGANFQQRDDSIVFDPIAEFGPRKKVAYELVLEPVEEADAQIALEISANHLNKPGRRIETIQIAPDALK